MNPNSSSDDSGMDALFQPMFRGGASGSTSAGKGLNANPQEEVADPLTQARQQGYQRGLSAGQHKACQIVQNNLSPLIEAVEAKLKQWDQNYRSLSESLSSDCLKLALDIAKKITGKDLQISLEDMAETQAIIFDAMEAAYRVSLQLNPGDLQLLQELSACEHALEWEQYESIAVCADETVASGALIQTKADPQWEAIQSKMSSTLAKNLNLHD